MPNFIEARTVRRLEEIVEALGIEGLTAGDVAGALLVSFVEAHYGGGRHE